MRAQESAIPKERARKEFRAQGKPGILACAARIKARVFRGSQTEAFIGPCAQIMQFAPFATEGAKAVFRRVQARATARGALDVARGRRLGFSHEQSASSNATSSATGALLFPASCCMNCMDISSRLPLILGTTFIFLGRDSRMSCTWRP